VEILSLKIFCPELQLYFVVAHQARVHRASADVQRDLSRWPECQYYDFGPLGKCGGSIIIPLHVNRCAPSANTVTLVKAKISANMLVRNIDATHTRRTLTAATFPFFQIAIFLHYCGLRRIGLRKGGG
jgi:hypothetical protein